MVFKGFKHVLIQTASDTVKSNSVHMCLKKNHHISLNVLFNTFLGNFPLRHEWSRTLITLI